MSPSSYKVEQEAFVSNLNGSHVGEILICIFHVHMFVLFLKFVQQSRPPSMVRELCLLVIPTIMIATISSQYNFWSLVIVHIVALIALLLMSNTESHNNTVHIHKNANNTYYLTLFKGGNVLLTCIAILAVDFTVFPRYFGKTETFGTSLMDAGVGAFIVSSAITSKYARGNFKSNTKSEPAIQSTSTSKSTASSRLKVLLCGLPYQRLFVLFLGVGRLVALKAISYQEHVSEYGIHWNFFVTLFCVWSAADFLHYIMSSRLHISLVALAMLICYQFTLINTSLTDYMFHAPRVTWFSSNKEGIVSLLGYIPLYLLAEGLSYAIFFNMGRSELSVVTTAVEDDVRNFNSQSSSHSTVDSRSNNTDTVLPGGSDTDRILLNTTNTALHVTSTLSDEYLMVDKESHGEPVRLTDSPLSTTDVLVVDTDNTDSHTNVSGYDNSSSFVPWNTRLLTELSLCNLLLWIAWIVSSAYIQRTSRRLVNLTYVLLTLALSFTIALCFYVVDTLGDRFCIQNISFITNDNKDTDMDSKDSTSSLDKQTTKRSNATYASSLSPVLTLEYMNKYSLYVFLGANLATGAVNSSVQTLYAQPIYAFGILCIYGVFLLILSWGCEYISSAHKNNKKLQKETK